MCCRYVGSFKSKSHLYIILEYMENGALRCASSVYALFCGGCCCRPGVHRMENRALRWAFCCSLPPPTCTAPWSAPPLPLHVRSSVIPASLGPFLTPPVSLFALSLFFLLPCSSVIKASKFGPFPESLVAVYIQQVLQVSGNTPAAH